MFSHSLITAAIAIISATSAILVECLHFPNISSFNLHNKPMLLLFPIMITKYIAQRFFMNCP